MSSGIIINLFLFKIWRKEIMTKIRKDQKCINCGKLIPKGTDVESRPQWRDGRVIYTMYFCGCTKSQPNTGLSGLIKTYGDQIAKNGDLYN